MHLCGYNDRLGLARIFFREGGRVCPISSTYIGNFRDVCAARPRPRRAAGRGGVRWGGVPVRRRGAGWFGTVAGLHRPCAAAKGGGTKYLTSLFPGTFKRPFKRPFKPPIKRRFTGNLRRFTDDLQRFATNYGRFATICDDLRTICTDLQ